MSFKAEPRVPKWPFFLADAILLGLAYFFYWQARLPLNLDTAGVMTACATLGAVLAIAPYLLEYRAAVKLAESDALNRTVDKVQQIETVASQITAATSQWQTVHEHATEAVTASRQVSEQMTGEMKQFMEFLEKANDSERGHLRLEVEKLRRAEQDWMHVLVGMLDHVFALHAAGLRSGQPRLTEQLTQFQHACREAARRVGLTPFEVPPGTEFDSEKHLLPEGKGAPADAHVAGTLATGYTFRGQLLRPALVSLESDAGAEATGTEPEQEAGRSESATQPSVEQDLSL